MRKSKFIRILKTLNEAELLQFEKFVLTPYFNTNKNINKLIHYTLSFFPDFDIDKLEDEAVHQHIFPKAKYIPSKRVVTKLSSKLLSLLTQFISLEKHLNSDFETKYNLLLHYRDHELVDDFHSLAKKIKQDYRKKKMSPSSLYEEFLIECEINRVISRTVDIGVGDVNFQNASEALDKYYIYNKLIYACQKVNRSQVIKGIETTNYLSQILDAIPETPHYEVAHINIWYKAYKFLTSTSFEEKKELYFFIKSELLDNKISIDAPQMRLLFTYLENAAISQFPQDITYKELYDLYQFQDENQILLNDKTAVPNLIKNYVVVLLNFDKHDEADTFLTSNKSSILPLFDAQYHLCRALIAFSRKDYDASLEILNHLSLKNIYLKINEKRLRIKIYHHLDYYDLLTDNINSFRVFLTNNKDSIRGFHLEANRNFLKFFSKIQKQKYNCSLEFIKEVDEAKELAEKKWLKDICLSKKQL